jgi:TRAP-type C4-dicarboxylate transport system permease small subunit
MDRVAHRLAVFSALLGGAMLCALILLTCVSVAGRAFVFAGLGPVPGDFELVEAGIAFAVFAFLPICQVQAGHATVDLFTNALGRAANRWLVAFWEGLFALVMVLIAWRLSVGMLTKFGNGETSMFLQFSTWWAYAACLLPATLAALVALWSAYDRLRAAVTGAETRPIAVEGGH